MNNSFIDSPIFENIMNACKITTYVGTSIVIIIFTIIGFMVLLGGDIKGLFFILFSVVAGILVYFGTDETCRLRALGINPNSRNNHGFTINFT